MFQPKAQFRIRRPSGARKSFSIQYKNESKWETYKDPDLDATNRLFKDGTLPYDQANKRVEVIMGQLYARRDAQNPKTLMLPGNLRILTKFIEETYTKKKKMRMAPRSFQTEEYALTKAVGELGNIPLDGDIEPIQDLFDEKYKTREGSHRKRVTAINRVRKWLDLDRMLHLPSKGKEVLFVTQEQVHELLRHIRQPETKTLAGLLFYSGLRLGEAFAIGENSVRIFEGNMVLHVAKQMYPDGTLAETKNKSNRNAFVIPGGEDFVTQWLQTEELTRVRKLKHAARIKEAASKIGFPDLYLHCLRHSYCVHLISKGCTLDWVANSAGHSREVCERYYASHRLTDDAMRLMAMALNRAN